MNPATDLTSAYIGNFRQIDDNLFAGAQPEISEGIVELASTYKVKTIVDLQAVLAGEADACNAAGISFHSIPLPGVEIVTDPPHDKIEAIMSVVNDPANAPVFVHCLHGADRTGAIFGIYRVENGATAGEAIDEMRRYHNSWIEAGYRDVVEDFYEDRVQHKQF
jgi:protein tyrosine/serine phosphatase